MTLDEEPSDETLMARYQEGDSKAFTIIFDRWGQRIYGFFLRSFRQQEVANDLLQVTFMKVHQGRAAYQKNLPFKPWIFTIAARVRIDELRKRYRLPAHVGDDDVDRYEQLTADVVSADEQMIRNHHADQIQRALDTLPESQRIAVHLHHFEGLTFAEIGRILGASEGAAKLRAFRAYAELRKRLRPMLGSTS